MYNTAPSTEIALILGLIALVSFFLWNDDL